MGIKDNFLEVHVSHIDERKINIAAEIVAVPQPIRLAVETAQLPFHRLRDDVYKELNT